MAHHMGREFTGKLAPVRESPQQFSLLSFVSQPNKAQIHFRRVLNILEILACSGYQEKFSIQLRRYKFSRDRADHIIQIQIIAEIRCFQQQGDIPPVAFIPAESVHIGGCTYKFNKKRSSGNIFHFRFLKTFFS